MYMTLIVFRFRRRSDLIQFEFDTSVGQEATSIQSFISFKNIPDYFPLSLFHHWILGVLFQNMTTLIFSNET